MPDSPPMDILPPLTVSLAGQPHSYPIVIGSGLLPSLGQRIMAQLPDAKRILLITDSNVAPHYLAPVTASLQAVGLTVSAVVLPPGEATKALSQLERLLNEAQTAHLKRSDVVLALGGGVIGDLAGLCAATYYRGTGFVQVPTTLLAQVDSSVGGKVAINWGAIKNAVGSFYQPHLVVSDSDTLTTLPARERLAGLAELYKYALIELTANDHPVPPSDTLWSTFSLLGADWADELPSLIRRACAIKAQVVARDATESMGPLEANGRVCLNLGHTFGHAYEAALPYGTVLHGEGVAIGMVHALAVSVELGLISADVARAIAMQMLTLGLPLTSPVTVDSATLLSHMAQDKKVIGSTLRLILPAEPVGTVVVKSDIPPAVLQGVLDKVPVWLTV